MDLFTNLLLLFVLILAIWKLHDLFFYQDKSIALRKARKANQKLNRFFAEFTHKTMNNKETYEEAPEEIYIWLIEKYQEWNNKDVK